MSSSIHIGGRFVNGKGIDQDVLVFALQLDDKNVLVAILPQKPGDAARIFDYFGKPVAMEGQLKVGEPEEGIKLNFDGELRLDDKRRVYLDAASVTVLDDKNKDKFPAEGKAYVEGPAICGKKDLKKFEEPTLAVQNGDAPVVLTGDKASDEAAKHGMIGVTGRLSVDAKKGLIVIAAEQVKDVKKE